MLHDARSEMGISAYLYRYQESVTGNKPRGNCSVGDPPGVSLSFDPNRSGIKRYKQDGMQYSGSAQLMDGQ